MRCCQHDYIIHSLLLVLSDGEEVSTQVCTILTGEMSVWLIGVCRLIMLLIFGDALKATLLLIFAIVSIAGGTVYTRSSFCQASGFLVQYGTETAGL